jgi:hypothetical protein
LGLSCCKRGRGYEEEEEGRHSWTYFGVIPGNMFRLPATLIDCRYTLHTAQIIPTF